MSVHLKYQIVAQQSDQYLYQCLGQPQHLETSRGPMYSGKCSHVTMGLSVVPLSLLKLHDPSLECPEKMQHHSGGPGDSSSHPDSLHQRNEESVAPLPLKLASPSSCGSLQAQCTDCWKPGASFPSYVCDSLKNYKNFC